jgi:hypothetical protein
LAEVDDFFTELDTKAIPHCMSAPVDQAANVARRRSAVVHNEIAMSRGDPRTSTD